jgi:hypothetical protein
VLGSLLQDEAMVGSAPTPLSRAFLHVANAIDDSLRVRVWTLGGFLKEKENGIFSRATERINSHRYSRAEAQKLAFFAQPPEVMNAFSCESLRGHITTVTAISAKLNN